jgi:hypothetical protein
LSLETTNLTATGVLGGNISESVITVTPIDENLAMRSNTVLVGDYVLAVPSATTNITPTGVVGGNTSESRISFTAIDIENMTSHRPEQY